MNFSESAPQVTPGTGLKTKAPKKNFFFVPLCNGSLQAWLKNWLEVSQIWHLVSQCCWWRFKLLKYKVPASISRIKRVHPSWASSKSEDGGSISQNAGIYLPIHTLWYPRRLNLYSHRYLGPAETA